MNLAHHTTPAQTSLAAWVTVEPRAGTLRAQVLDFLRECDRAGATDEEMQRYLPMDSNTQRPRRIELVRGGFVEASGRTRTTLSGESAVVWLAKECA